MRKHGLACDNLVGADVVTADGTIVHTSETENPELLRGLRGGGGNFGIVTQLEYQLHPVGPIVYAGPVFFPASASADLLRRFRDWQAAAPDDVTAVINLTTAPPLPVIPEEWHGKKVAVLLTMSAAPLDDGPALYASLREVAEPVADLLGPMPYTVLQSLIDPLWPEGIRSYFKATNLSRLDDELIDTLCELHLAAPGPQCEIHVHQMGGAMARVPEDASSFGERSMPYVLNAVTGWQDEADDEAHIAWARKVIAAAEDASTGRAYTNYLGDRDAARSAYGSATYAKLAALKAKYDPTNIFRLNQNIEPASANGPPR
jgi:FAD/FMN-containing dehydrogenase